MKLKITKPDGTTIEAEGTAEELERVVRVACPIPFAISVPPIRVDGPVWPGPLYPQVTWGDQDTGHPPPVSVPSIWSQADLPLAGGSYQVREAGPSNFPSTTLIGGPRAQ